VLELWYFSKITNKRIKSTIIVK